MAGTETDFAQALANCSRDPIHVPGRIQSYGLMVATNLEMTEITHVSENLSRMTGAAAADLLGQEPDRILSKHRLHGLRNTLGHPTISTQRELAGFEEIDGTSYQVSVYLVGERAVLEWLPERGSSEDKALVVDQARAFLAPPEPSESINQLLNRAVERLRYIVGFDRVKAYRFLPDGAGEVVAEARRPDMESFLGLRFPEEDIPAIARRLYASTPIRFLHNIAAPDTPVLALDPLEAPLDMSLAVLRGLDPVHRQYLDNMGIVSTLTIPIVVDGTLWGLFACHHVTEKTPDPAALNAAELAGKLLSLRIQHTLELQREARLRSSLQIANRLVVADDSELSAGQYWVSTREDLAQLIPCDGMIFSIGDRIETFGNHPASSACRALLARDMPEGKRMEAIQSLSGTIPTVNWGETGGAFILDVGGESPARLIFLRDLSDHKVTWAGRPAKDVVQAEDGPRLNPRASFETYIETVAGQCEDWRGEDVAMGEALQVAFEQAISTQVSLRSNRHRMGLLVRELNHRVRNILSLVQSLSAHSRAGSESVESYAKALESRIVALAGAHNLLTQSEMHGVNLADLIELELRPYHDSQDGELYKGPELFLRSDAASVVALVLHELTTNAAKYGALSVPNGKVRVTWSHDPDGVLLSWRETGGPASDGPPTKEGFGRSIIDSAIPYEFGGRADWRLTAQGVVAEFWLPEALLVEAPSDGSHVAVGSGVGRRDGTVTAAGRARALVVEDNFVVAIQSKNLLVPEFFDHADTAPTIEDALAALKVETYDFCLLDLNIRDEYSTAVASALERLGIPYFFATGYGSDGREIVGDYSAPVLAKPIKIDMLRRMLQECLGRS